MERILAERLMQKLKAKCPIDTGALRASISQVQGNETEWLITIGNEDASINGTPTIQYAELLNFSFMIRGHKNKHYHWVNEAIKEWVQENKLHFEIQTDVDSEDTEEEFEDLNELEDIIV